MKGTGDVQQEMWRKYIRGELPAEQSERMEKLLLEDDDIFQVYMQELLATETELPTLKDEEAFADGVLSLIPQSSRKRVERSPRKRWHHPLLHYVIAASITLLLLGGGVFDLLSAGAGAAMERQASDKPLSEQLMKRATDWMDRIKPANP